MNLKTVAAVATLYIVVVALCAFLGYVVEGNHKVDRCRVKEGQACRFESDCGSSACSLQCEKANFDDKFGYCF